MNGKKIAGLVLLLGGLILLLLSLAADVIGIGRNTGFGPGQIAGTIVGLIAIAGGFFLSSKKKES